MTRPRFNFDVILDPADAASLTQLKSGDRVQVDRQEAEIVLSVDNANLRLGTLPSDALEAYHPNVIFEGFVRCVARKKESNALERVCVCLAPCRKRREGEVPRWERETVEEEWLLKPQHYEALVANSEVREMLRDEKLQSLLQAIDTSDQKETALHEAYGSSKAVQEFFHRVLDTLHRSMA